MRIAHQFGDAMHSRIVSAVGGGAEVIQLDGDDPWAGSPGCDALLCGPAAVRRAPPTAPAWITDLRWVHFRTTGIDAAPGWLLTRPWVTVSRGAQAVGIAEYVLAAMLAHEKHIPQIWARSPADWTRHRLGGLSGRVLGIVGYGSVGTEIARRAVAFNMQVIACRRSQTPIIEPGVTLCDQAAVLERSDHLVLCAALTPQTRQMMDGPAFARLKPGCHLVNIGRGALINQDALKTALDDGKLAAATLDVWTPEPPPPDHWIYCHRNVRISPHLSFSAPTSEAAGERILFSNLAAFVEGRNDALHGRISLDAGY
jgi:phosphoglycerate dehydrogenase-like enzyme